MHRLALSVASDGSVAGEAADAHRGHVADTHGNALALRDDDGLDVVDRTHAALDPDEQCLLAVLEPPRAVVAIVGLQRLLQLRDADAAALERRIVGHDLERAHHAAQRVHIRHAGQRAQCRADHPVEQTPALGCGEITALDGEHEHLAERRGDGGETARHRRRQVLDDVVEALGHLLPRPVDVGAVVEVDGDVGDRVLRRRPQNALARNAQHLQFDRGDDARFHLLRRHARCLHDDLHLGG